MGTTVLREIDRTAGQAEARLAAGNRHFAESRFDDAGLCYREAVESAPEWASARYNLALALDRTGRHAEAAEQFKQVLLLDPRHASAALALGSLAEQAGNSEEAAGYFWRAAEVTGDGKAHAALARLYEIQGRLDEALSCRRHLVAALPEDAAQHQALGNLFRRLGRIDQAVACYQTAAALEPGGIASFSLGLALLEHGDAQQALALFDELSSSGAMAAEALVNAGVALRLLQRDAEAVGRFEQALALRPSDPRIRGNLAETLAALGHHGAAIPHYRQALGGGESVRLLVDLGRAQSAAGRLSAAMKSLERALELAPNDIKAICGLGHILAKDGRLEAALAAFQQAAMLGPDSAVAWSHLGTGLHDLGRYDEALDAFDRSISLQPEYDAPRLNRALILLLRGDFDDGWDGYEWRFKRPELAARIARFAAPMWSGTADLMGKRLLCHAEQGFGDTIQFIRYAELALKRGAIVTVAVPPALLSLVARSLPNCAVVDCDGVLPPFDEHCPLMSLPRAFGTTQATIPVPGAYLVPDPVRIVRWRHSFGPRQGLRVGLAWAGNAALQTNSRRSIPLSMLRQLWSMPEIEWVSLQKGISRADQDELDALGGRLVLLGDVLDDFDDTAAVMMELDLVIAVDTAVAHLSGALGREVWILLPFVPDWRWRLGRTESDWYPTARLFRQERSGDWLGVMNSVAESLSVRRAEKNLTRFAAQARRVTVDHIL